MSASHTTTPALSAGNDWRELAVRDGDGIEVRLLWSRSSDRVKVTVADAKFDEEFEIDVASADALVAFDHPSRTRPLGASALSRPRARPSTCIRRPERNCHVTPESMWVRSTMTKLDCGTSSGWEPTGPTRRRRRPSPPSRQNSRNILSISRWTILRMLLRCNWWRRWPNWIFLRALAEHTGRSFGTVQERSTGAVAECVAAFHGHQPIFRKFGRDGGPYGGQFLPGVCRGLYAGVGRHAA